MVAAAVVLLARLPRGLALADALAVAGGFGKLHAVDFSVDVHRRYTFWSGLLGGLLPGAVVLRHRPVAGPALPLGRLPAREPARAHVQRGLQDPDADSSSCCWGRWSSSSTSSSGRRSSSTGPRGSARRRGRGRASCGRLEAEFAAAHAERAPAHPRLARGPARRRRAGRGGRGPRRGAGRRTARPRRCGRRPGTALSAAGPRAPANDADYVFITFMLDHLPHGLIGLLVAVVLRRRHVVEGGRAQRARLDHDRRFLPAPRQARRPTTRTTSPRRAGSPPLWGLVAIGFALFANLAENLIQAVNILGLGLLRRGARAVPRGVLPPAGRRDGRLLGGARRPGARVRALFHASTISYLWYNLIGCAACVVLSLASRPARARQGGRAGIDAMSPPVICFGQQPCGFFPAALPGRQDPDGPAAPGRDRRRDRLLLPRQRPRPARDPDHPAPPQDRRARAAQLRLREPGSSGNGRPCYLKRVAAGWHADHGAPAAGLRRPRAGSAAFAETSAATRRRLLPGDVPADGPARGDPGRALGRSRVAARRLRRRRISSSTSPTRARSSAPASPAARSSSTRGATPT